MEVKDKFFRLGTFKLGQGTQIRFWEDTWLGKWPLKLRFPSLYNIVRKKHDTVASV